MDGDNSLNTRNWSYYEPAPAMGINNLGLQLMPTMPEKPLLDTRSAAFMSATGAPAPFLYHREFGAPIPQPMFSSMEYMRDAPTRRFFSGTSNYPFFLETPSTPASLMQTVQQPQLIKTERAVADEIENGTGNGVSKKRQCPKVPNSPKPKKAKKGPQAPKPEKTPSAPRARSVKKTTEVMVNGNIMDISSIPIPVCSCTGNPQQCYRWGSGGWQSACCTTGVSMYPLPMSTKRRGARIAGRKMSIGAFKKVLEKHALEGYNFGNPIDLKTHWAKHGTNKFVTIR